MTKYYGKTPRQIVIELVETHQWHSAITDVDPRTNKFVSGKVGEVILNLPEEQRKTLSTLKSDDLVDIVWPRWNGIGLSRWLC